MTILEELKHQSEERFLAIYEALAQQGFGPLDLEVAKSLKFRPQAIRKLPMEKRARVARRILTSSANAEQCYQLFGTYLVQTKKDLVTDFLDATGIEHEDGMIEDVDAGDPEAEKVREAVRVLDEKFEPADVTLYLALGTEMWPDCEVLVELWKKRNGVEVSS